MNDTFIAAMTKGSGEFSFRFHLKQREWSG